MVKIRIPKSARENEKQQHTKHTRRRYGYECKVRDTHVQRLKIHLLTTKYEEEECYINNN